MGRWRVYFNITIVSIWHCSSRVCSSLTCDPRLCCERLRRTCADCADCEPFRERDGHKERSLRRSRSIGWHFLHQLLNFFSGGSIMKSSPRHINFVAGRVCKISCGRFSSLKSFFLRWPVCCFAQFIWPRRVSYRLSFTLPISCSSPEKQSSAGNLMSSFLVAGARKFALFMSIAAHLNGILVMRYCIQADKCLPRLQTRGWCELGIFQITIQLTPNLP